VSLTKNHLYYVNVLCEKLFMLENIPNEALMEPTAKSFVNKVDLTPKGITGALAILYKHDLIQKDESGLIQVIDPALAYCLAR
jgi:hypothetical protein